MIAHDRETAANLDVFARDMEAVGPQAWHCNVKAVAEKIKEDVQYAIQFGADLEKFEACVSALALAG